MGMLPMTKGISVAFLHMRLPGMVNNGNLPSRLR
jgi:hypothetical protein